jgi:cellulase/cellobiase CelA1
VQIFGTYRKEVTEDWKILHEELHDLYSMPNVSQMRRMGHLAYVGWQRNVFRALVGRR